MKTQILEYLATNPPVAKRRAWWNIARGIGRPNDEAVKPALNELLAAGLIRRQSGGKGHPFATLAALFIVVILAGCTFPSDWRTVDGMLIDPLDGPRHPPVNTNTFKTYPPSKPH